MMKYLLGLGLLLVMGSLYRRMSGDLRERGTVYKVTAPLVWDPNIIHGKHAKVVFNVSFERSRFVLDGNAYSIARKNSESWQVIESLRAGDIVTISFAANEEERTHSFTNEVDALGLQAGGKIIVSAETTDEKNDAEFWITAIAGLAMTFVGGIAILHRRLSKSEIS